MSAESSSEEHSDGEEYTGSESGSTEEGSGSESGSYEEGSEEETDEEASDHEEDEPVLKYRRFAKEVVNSISGASEEEKNIICCISVHPKFIALGTYDGTIKLLDHTGTFLKDRVYTLHTAQINQISLDEEGEFLASCSDDGKVSIVGLFTTKYNNTVPFDRQVKSLAIHPHFSKSTNRVFVIGHDRLVMIEERRWPLGNKVTELHGGYGFISTIKWKESLIAWANERMVVVYDTGLKQRISSITFEEESPAFLPCSLYWQDISTLLIGRGHLVKTVMVKESEGDSSVTFSGDVDAMMKRRRFMAIVAQNTFPQFLVCGVVPLFDDKQEWKLVVLGYNAEVDQHDAIQKGTVPPPHLVVVSPGWYLQQGEGFETPEYNARDKLLPRGHNFCRCEEYHLECILREDRFYILTPIDIILAQKRDATDHIEWLMKKRDFEGAMKYAENPDVAKMVQPGKLQDIGVQYIYHLIKSKKYPEAARKCPEVFGPTNKSRWEDVILSFLQAGQLQEIRPFIPTSEPQLSAAIYELVLNTFLQEDCKILFELIKAWPTSLYNPQAIINAVQDKLKEVRDPEAAKDLLKVKASLHEDLGQYDEALKIYLQQGHSEVFDLIHERKLYSALVENLIPLMRVDVNKAAKLLVDCKADVQPQRVVKELESTGHEEYLHKYLDCMFEHDPKSGGKYHERQVELYAKFEPNKLLPFLRSCNDIPLQKALQICRHYGMYAEMVYLLARMGNPKAALELIINQLQDVNKAIEFAMEEGDEELWEVLISLSIHKPTFITGLLNNVGTHIDPTRLIKQIPEGTEIPDLGISLVKLLQDFRVQVNLREGCKKILVKDSQSLMEKLFRLQKKGVYIDDEAICKTCGAEVIAMDEDADYIVFFCGHIYHRRCVSTKNEMMTCRLCYAGANSLRKKSEQLSPRKQRL